ncbi:MAG: hypothetical protein ACTSU5_05205 [Promethearchaeota archaeon]
MSKKTLDAREDSLKVEAVTMYKHGVAFFTLRGRVSGKETLTLDFKKDEMNDVLKSLLVTDLSDAGGFISSIAYDAEQDIGKMLEEVAIDLASKGSFVSLLENFRGAGVEVELGGFEKVVGKVMGVQTYEVSRGEQVVALPSLVVLRDDGTITQVKFTDVRGFKLLDEKLQSDLEFYLKAVVSGKKKDSKRIFIHCEGEGEREIVASYILESPVWKTSYRLVIPDDLADKGEVFLNGWCLVENTTTQDWDEIKLTLVAGMPVSFVCPIYPPIYMERPVVEPPKAAQIGPAELDEEFDDGLFDRVKEKAKAAAKTRSLSTGGGMAARKPAIPAAAAPAPPPALPPMMELANEQAVKQTRVSTKDMGELFQYEIAKPVSIKRKKSALVPIVAKDMKGRRILLYEENQHPQSPMACLEVTNTSGVTLEGGPVTIFFEENLAGEALLPFLNQDETRLISYALEQGVVVDKDVKTKTLGVHRVQFSGRYSYEYYYNTRKTTYKVKNKTDREHALYIDHPKSQGYELVDPAVEPRDTPNFHRFPLEIGPKKAIKFEVYERNEDYSQFNIWEMDKKDFLARVQNYKKHEWIDPAKETPLKKVAEQLEKLQLANREKATLEDGLAEITDEQHRLRENLKSIGRSSSEQTLREKYIKKLDEQETQLEKIRERLRELEKTVDELDRQVSDLLNEVEREGE